MKNTTLYSIAVVTTFIISLGILFFIQVKFNEKIDLKSLSVENKLVENTKIFKDHINSINKSINDLSLDLKDRKENLAQLTNLSNQIQVKINLLEKDLATSLEKYHLKDLEIEKEISDLWKTLKKFIDQVSEIQDYVDKTNININPNTIIDLRKQISELSEELDTNYSIVALLYLFVFIFFLVSLIFLILFIVTKNKLASQQDSIDNIVAKSNNLDNLIYDHLTNYVDKLIAETKDILSIYSQNSSNIEEQHSIVKTVANRLSFMEVTMSKMDPSVRGFKQLSKSISQMKDNLKANGYEIVDMLGKPYNAGMKVVANFIDDEDFPKGVQKITSVIKPQINFEGVMIQSAQITVTQNL